MANTLRDFDFSSLVSDPIDLANINPVFDVLQRNQIEQELLRAQGLDGAVQNQLAPGVSGQAAGQTGAQSLQFGTPPPDLASAPAAAPGAPRSRQADEQFNRSLIRLKTLDPTGAASEFAQSMRINTTARKLANNKLAMDTIFRETNSLLKLKDNPAALERGIIRTIRERANSGVESPALERILQLSQERRLVGLEQRKAINTDIKALIDNEQKELDRQSREDIAAAQITGRADVAAAALGAKPIEERTIDVPGGKQQRQRVNPSTRLFENVGEAFDPTITSAEKLKEEKGVKEADSARSFLNASMLEEKKLKINEGSKTGKLKIAKLEREIAAFGLEDQKKEFRRKSKIMKADLVIGKIDEAAKFIKENWLVTGFMGGLLQSVGGTDARNLRGMIDTIKANIGFAELQAMRDASPTGGALGQVAVQEINFLQSTIAALDQAQDDDILLQNLQQVKASMERIKKIQLDAVAGQGALTIDTPGGTPAEKLPPVKVNF